MANSLVQCPPGQSHLYEVRISQNGHPWDGILGHNPFIQYNLCEFCDPEQSFQLLPREVKGIVLYDENLSWNCRITGQYPLVEVGILSRILI